MTWLLRAKNFFIIVKMIKYVEQNITIAHNVIFESRFKEVEVRVETFGVDELQILFFSLKYLAKATLTGASQDNWQSERYDCQTL